MSLRPLRCSGVHKCLKSHPIAQSKRQVLMGNITMYSHVRPSTSSCLTVSRSGSDSYFLKCLWLRLVFPTGQPAGYAIDTLLSFCFNSVKTPIVQNRNSKSRVSFDQSVEKFPERPAPFFYTCSSSRAHRHRHTSAGTVYRRRLASRSDSSRQRMSFSRTVGDNKVSACVRGGFGG